MRLEVHVHADIPVLEGVSKRQIEQAFAPLLEYLDADGLADVKSLEPDEPGIRYDEKELADLVKIEEAAAPAGGRAAGRTDWRTRREIAEKLRELSRALNLTVLLVEQDLHFIAESVGNATIGQHDAEPESRALSPIDCKRLPTQRLVDDAVGNPRS